MSGLEIGLIIAGAMVGGFVNGLAGFGTGLFALGFFLQVLSPIESVALTLLMSVTSGIQGLWHVRETMLKNWRRLSIFLIPAFVGIPLGVTSLKHVDVSFLKLVIAVFLLIYSGFFLVRRNLPKIQQPLPLVDGLIGFLGGFLGGLASLSGALPTVWSSMRPWSKAEIRAVLQPYNMTVLGLSALLLAFRGAYDVKLLQAVIIAVITSFLAAHVGLLIFKQLADSTFQRLVIAMCGISGSVLLLRELL